jgi:hypothetical protein
MLRGPTHSPVPRSTSPVRALVVERDAADRPTDPVPVGRRLSSLTAFFPARDEEDNVTPMAEALLRVLPALAERTEL